MSVHPQAQALLDFLAQSGLDFDQPDAQTLRESRTLPPPENPEHVHAVVNQTIPGPAGDIPVRIYTPEGSGPFALMVYFHGGGFVIGDLESHDGVCRSLCNEANMLVISVDYRLAPEHRYPAAVDDSYAAMCWAAENAQVLNADPARLVVAGDSAGANLAAVTALKARDESGPSIASQVLIYPVADMDFDRPSYTENAEGYFLTRDMMRWFMAQYLGHDQVVTDPLVCPLQAESLKALPPALVITAEYDPLRDEGEALAQALLEAGVKTELVRFNGMIHGFVSLAEMLDDGKAALKMIGRKLREQLA